MISEFPNPATFFLKSGRLYAYVNQTSVLHVNVIESKISPLTGKDKSAKPGLMKLQLDTKRAGLDVEFFWTISSLHFRVRDRSGSKKKKESEYEEGSANGGLWWACEEQVLDPDTGRKGRALYADFGTQNFRLRMPPGGCDGWTLHSLGLSIEQQN